jgi:hypothetical protein
MVKEFKKYPKIYTIGHEENKDIFSNPEDIILIQEKIDGGNFRFMIKDNKVIFGSRTMQLTDDEGGDTNVPKDFKSCCDYVRDKINKCDVSLDRYEGYIFFGEACHKHTINYNWEKIPRFLGFDIFDMQHNKFIYPLFYADFQIEEVPFVKECKVSEIGEINDKLVPISAYAPLDKLNMQAEGIVIKNYSKQILAKYVRNEFKEKNTEAFGGTPKYNKEDDTDNAEFLFKYCTNPRIDKIVFKLLDSGEKLDLKLMSKLPKLVYQDILEENWNEILNSNWKLDFKGLRQKVPKRCLSVLQQIMVNNVR